MDEGCGVLYTSPTDSALTVRSSDLKTLRQACEFPDDDCPRLQEELGHELCNCVELTEWEGRR